MSEGGASEGGASERGTSEGGVREGGMSEGGMSEGCMSDGGCYGSDSKVSLMLRLTSYHLRLIPYPLTLTLTPTRA